MSLYGPFRLYRRGIAGVLAAGLCIAGTSVPARSAPARSAPKPSCLDVVPTKAAASSMARACHRRVENLSARSESARVFANPDGSWTTELAATPQRVRRADGAWTDVDPTLRRNADGSWSPEASTADVRFSAGGGDPMVSLTKGGRSFTLDWPSPLPPPVVDGATAIYRDVRSGVDLVLRATVDGFTHVLVVKTAEAARSPALRRIAYRLGGSGVRFAATGDGGVMVRGDDGTPVLRSGGAALWDSRSAPPPSGPGAGRPGGPDGAAVSSAQAAGDGARTAQAPTRLQGDRLVIEPDAGLMAAATLPLFIDPVWTSPGMSRWAYATSNNSNNENSQARVGRSPDSGLLYRSYFEFPTHMLAGARILSASFRIVVYHTWSCGPSPIYLWRSAPIGGTPRTAWAPPFQRYIDSQSAAANKEDCYTPNTPTMTFGQHLTGDVQTAASGGWGTYTLALTAMDSGGGGESTQSRWKRFLPGTAVLTVLSNRAPGAPTAAEMSIDPSYQCGPSPARVNARGGLTLRARLSDPDGDNVQAQWQVTGIPPQYAPADSGFAASGPFSTTLPAEAFTDGGTYAWTVRGTDGTDAGSFGASCPFVVDNSVPGAPAAASTELALSDGLIAPAPPSTAVVGRAAAVSLAPAPGDQNVAGYLIGVGAGVGREPVVWVPASADGRATAPVVPVASGTTVNFLTVRARKLSGQAGGTVTLRFRATAAPATTRVPGDATGDGRADVTALADLGNGSSALWRWNARGDGGGVTPPSAPQDLVTVYPTAETRVAGGDFDGDGRSDVAVFRQQGGSGVTLSVQRSDGNALLGTHVKTLDSGWHVSKMKVVVANFDNDGAGRDDLAVVFDHGNLSYSFRVFLATGAPGEVSFADWTNWWTNPIGWAGWQYLKPFAGDFDGDGHPDLAVIYEYGNCQTKLWIHFSLGTSFAQGSLVWDSQPGRFCWDRSDPVAGDFDGDGRADVTVVYRYDGCQTNLWTFYGNANRTVHRSVVGPEWDGGGQHRWCAEKIAPVAGDFDRDGRTDLAAVYRCCGSYQAKLYTFASTARAFADPVFRWEGALGPVSAGSATVDPAAQYQIVNVGSGKCLMVPGGEAAQLVQQSCATAANSRFTVERLGGEFVRLRMVHAPASCVDVRGASPNAGAAIQQWVCTGNTAQQFRLNYISGFADPVLSIAAYLSGQVLDVHAYGTADNVPIQQWPFHGATNQLFQLRRVA